MARKDITDRQVVEACRKSKLDLSGKQSLELLIDETGQPPKVAYMAMKRAHRNGLVEYGTSLATAWPTDKGLALINEKDQ
jgi:hypothetical protein